MQNAVYQKWFPFTGINADQDYCEKLWGSRADGLFYRFSPPKIIQQEWAKRTVANSKALNLYASSDLHILMEQIKAHRSKIIKYLFINERDYGRNVKHYLLPSSVDNLNNSILEILNLTPIGQHLVAGVSNTPLDKLGEFDILRMHYNLLPIHEITSPKWVVELLASLAPELPTHSNLKSRLEHLWFLSFLDEKKDLAVVEDFWGKIQTSYLKLIVEAQDKASVPMYNYIHSVMQNISIHKGHRVLRAKKDILYDTFSWELDNELDWLTQNFNNDSPEELLVKKYFQETFGHLGKIVNRNPMREVPAYFDKKVKDVVHWEYDFSLWLLQDKLQEASLWPILEDTWDFSLIRSGRANLRSTGWYNYCNTFIGSNPRLININQILSTLGPLPEDDPQSRQISAWRALWFKELLSGCLVPEEFKKLASYSKVIKE